MDLIVGSRRSAVLTRIERSTNFGSSEIWSDKLKVHIIGTRRHGGDGGKGNITEVPTAQRATEV